jgi:hypothetical protein
LDFYKAKQTIKKAKNKTYFMSYLIFFLLSLLTFHSAFITDKLNKKEPEEKRREKRLTLNLVQCRHDDTTG